MVKRGDKRHAVEYANLTIKFGNQDLLDYLEEIFIPVFFEDYTRKLKDGTEYRFIESEITRIVLDEITYTCLATRFVKSMVLISEQRLENGLLVEENESMKTSPSTFVLIILEIHKLIMIHETKNAPSTEALENTLRMLIRNRRARYIREYKNIKKNEGIKINISEIDRQFGKFSIDIIPLSNRENLETFLNAFKELNTIEVKLIKPNTERHMGNFFATVEEARKNVDSDVTTVRHHNKNGLAKKESIEQLEAAVRQGNSRIKFEGSNENGDIVSGDNRMYKIRTYISNIPRRMESLARVALELLKGNADQSSDPRLRDENITRKTHNLNIRRKT